MTSRELYTELRELTNKVLKYQPIHQSEAIGKVIEKFCKTSYRWNILVFTDGTALYYDKGGNCEETVLNIADTWTKDAVTVDSYLTELGDALLDEGLLNEEYIPELLEITKQWRELGLKKERESRIEKLRKQLTELENVS